MTVDAPRVSDFAKLWAALSVSVVGSEVTALALPLLAALSLRVSPLEMGALAAAGQLPFLLFSLPAGVWVDRLPRRPVLIGTDLASCLLLLSVPGAVAFGGPTFVHLCIVAFGVGTMTVVGEVAHYAYVPSLVGRGRLTECNSKLQVSYSVAGAAGPGLAGVLVQVLSAPVAIVADAASFVVSAVLLHSIRQSEGTAPSADRLPLGRSIVDGLRMLLGHPLLRAIIVPSVPIAFFTSGFLALYVLYATRELHLDAAVIGLVFAAGGLGAVVGAVLAGRVADRLGVGTAIIGGWVLAGASSLLVPLAAGPAVLVIATLAVAKALEGLTDTVANIHQWSLRQAVTRDEFAGRVTAGHRFTVYGAAACGAFVGGVLGEAIGLRSALLVCALGAMVSPLGALFSPLRRVRSQPTLETA